MATTFQPIHCAIKSENLELGKDFAIVSMEHIKHDFPNWDEDWEDGFSEGIDCNDTEVIDQICGFNSLEFLRSSRIFKNHRPVLKAELEKRGFGDYEFHETRFVPDSIFYLPKQPIDLIAAHTFGLGVVQILRGNYKGEFMLYNNAKMDAADLAEEDAQDEQMMLRLYFQYTSPFAHFDEYVADLIENRWDLASILIVNHKQYMRDYFQAISAYHLAKEKGSVHIDMMRVIRGMKLR